MIVNNDHSTVPLFLASMLNTLPKIMLNDVKRKGICAKRVAAFCRAIVSFLLSQPMRCTLWHSKEVVISK